LKTHISNAQKLSWAWLI